jgi:hypothetical protein
VSVFAGLASVATMFAYLLPVQISGIPDSITRLPPVVDARQLFRSHILRGRGEFETSEEFERRRDRLPHGNAAMRVDPKCYSISYDADSAAVVIILGNMYWPSIAVACSHTRRGTYTAHNGFGARFSVDVVFDTTLAFESPWAVRQAANPSPVWQTSMTRPRARATLRRLQVFAWVSVDPTETEFTTTPYDPTVSNPTDGALYIGTLRSSDLVLILFDPVARKVVATTKLCRTLAPGCYGQ